MSLADFASLYAVARPIIPPPMMKQVFIPDPRKPCRKGSLLDCRFIPPQVVSRYDDFAMHCTQLIVRVAAAAMFMAGVAAPEEILSAFRLSGQSGAYGAVSEVEF